MENVNRWYFTKEELAQTPSRKSGIDANKELSYRQQAANFIQDMGQRLQVTQLCINTAIVYMHRFYVFHSFSEVHRNSLSVAALFLAAKVEEQPRKLEHVIKTAHHCLHKDSPPLDCRTEAFSEKQFEVVAHENVLLQTLGFVLAIEHPHTYVVKVCQLVKASKDLAQTSYFMATTSLHMTTMCLQYRPTVVACVCIHLACKWSSWKIEPCSEGKQWYYYVDKSVTLDLLETLTQEFIAILETSPHKFKRKFTKEGHTPKAAVEFAYKQQALCEGKAMSIKREPTSPLASTSSISFNISSSIVDEKQTPVPIKVEKIEKPALQPSMPTRPPSPPMPPVPTQHAQSPHRKVKTSSHSISIDVYREKKEKERQEHKPIIEPPPPPQLPIPAKSLPSLPSLPELVKNIGELVKNAPNVKPPANVSIKVEKREKSPPPTTKEKLNKSSFPPTDQMHLAVEKVNHHPLKVKSEPNNRNGKEIKSPKHKIPSVSNEMVVVLERVDAIPDMHNLHVSGFSAGVDGPHTPPRESEKVHDHKRRSHSEKLSGSHGPVTSNLRVSGISPGSDSRYTPPIENEKISDQKRQSQTENAQSSGKMDLAGSFTPEVASPHHEKVRDHKRKQEKMSNLPEPDARSSRVSDVPRRSDNLHSQPHEKIRDHKRRSQVDKVITSQEPVTAPLPVSTTKSKHAKHKTNSLHNSAQPPLPQLLSPIKDLKTNGSKETGSCEKQNVVNNVINVKTESTKHEKKERHKSKHSSKDKSIGNHSEHLTPAIKVKIRKDIINLPDKSQKPPLPHTPETAKKSLKIKLPKPPSVDPEKGATPTSIKLVITKDKSGSGSYCTSHKKDRQSKKRSHSPSNQDSNSKHYGETPTKHTKYDHSHSSHPSTKQSKSRHSSSKSSSNDVSSKKHRLVNDTSSYLKVDVETYGDQPYYNSSNNQFSPYQITQPLYPTPRLSGNSDKTNSTLSDFAESPPPLPPPQYLPPLPPE